MQKNVGLQTLSIGSGLLLLAALYMVFMYAPLEAVMGSVQRVFYFHVAAGWVGALALFVAFVAGLLYLRRGGLLADRVALCSSEIGLVFISMNIASGAIWARPIWNTLWTWDPRLTTATITWLLYAAYLLLRQGIEDPQRRGRFAAVYGVIAFASVPLTFAAIRIFRSIHPVVIGAGAPGAKGSFDMTPAMRDTLLFSVFAFTVLYGALLWHRLRLEQLSERVAQLRLRVLQA